jgi:hypothetical protein
MCALSGPNTLYVAVAATGVPTRTSKTECRPGNEGRRTPDVKLAGVFTFSFDAPPGGLG